MRRIVLTAMVVWMAFFGAFAQKSSEVGLSVGVSNFLGDLGGTKGIGKPFLKDLNTFMFRPAVTGFYRYNTSYRTAVKFGFTWLQIAGDDSRIKSNEIGTYEWFRKNRNLHFRSNVAEFSVLGEFNILKYEPGKKRMKWTPVLFAGVSLFYHNPKALYNGEWVGLRQYRTEGQGLPGYPGTKQYSLIQPSIPLGIGVKYNVNRQFSLGFEITHRITFTDYLDDVSTDYVDPSVYEGTFTTKDAQIASDLANRAFEVDQERIYWRYTAPGYQRGNPEKNDSFFSTQVTATYKIGSHKKYYRSKVYKRKYF